MAGTIVADDIQHSTAGSVGTEYVVRGSAKAWVNFNGTGTISTRDSFNVSSLTDLGTGYYQTNFINSMGNVNYSPLVGSSWAGSLARPGWSGVIDSYSWVTDSIRTLSQFPSNYATFDPTYQIVAIQGDLA